MTIKDIYLACDNLDSECDFTIHYGGEKKRYTLDECPSDFFLRGVVKYFQIPSENHVEFFLGRVEEMK